MTSPLDGFSFPLPNSAGDVARSLDAREAFLESQRKRSPAGLIDNLIDQIKSFEASLGPDSELVVHFLGPAAAVGIRVRDISVYPSGLVVFEGIDGNSAPARILQHVSQIALALMSLSRLDPGEPKKVIGFHHMAAETIP